MKKLNYVMSVLILLSLLLAIFILSPSCGGKKTEQQPAATQTATYPDTTGTALWTYLKNADYQDNWQMWPGKTAYYPGTQPHGALLTTYINMVAFNAITAKVGMLPDSSIIVKENYKPDSTLESHTVMYKVKGYNPAADNWYWAKFSPTGEVQAEGKVGMCISCHQEKKDNDYIQTAPLK